MRALSGRRVAVLAVLALVLSAGVAAAVPAERVLVVADAGTGERLLVRPVAENTTVTLAYVHSVERTPVRDVYAVRGTRLENTRMLFQSYGWGLPAGAAVRRVDGWFVFDPAGTYDDLYVKPGRVAGHELGVGDETYDLVALSSARTVRVGVERRSALAAALSNVPVDRFVEP